MWRNLNKMLAKLGSNYWTILVPQTYKVSLNYHLKILFSNGLYCSYLDIAVDQSTLWRVYGMKGVTKCIFRDLWESFFQELGTLIFTYSKNCIYVEPDTFELEICSVFITRLAQLENNALTSNTIKHKCWPHFLKETKGLKAWRNK